VAVNAEIWVRFKATRLLHAIKTPSSELEKGMIRFEKDMKRVREEVHQLLVRHRSHMGGIFVQRALSETRFRSTNEIYEIVTSPLTFTESEIADFNLSSRYTAFECCGELAGGSSENYQEPPLRWYEYTSVDGRHGYCLVETKMGPFHYSTNKVREDESANLQTIYGLVRQFKAANGDENDKFGVLPCQGFYYHSNLPTDRSIFLIWDPPVAVSRVQDIPRVTTLRDALVAHPQSVVKTKLALRLVKAVYELLQARWYHRSISVNNVIAFNDNWEKPYLVGFRTARFTDGLSDPTSRPAMQWKDRYMQHPERYVGNMPTACRFRMKHDIFGLGVLLLELQKGRYFGSLEQWGNLSAVGLRKEFVEFAQNRECCLLGERCISPIVHCLKGFEKLDKLDDRTCHPRVLREFRKKVLDPIASIEEGRGFGII
jgi:hypothetical protein